MESKHGVPQYLLNIKQCHLVLASGTLFRSDRACQIVAILYRFEQSTVSDHGARCFGLGLTLSSYPDWKASKHCRVCKAIPSSLSLRKYIYTDWYICSTIAELLIYYRSHTENVLPTAHTCFNQIDLPNYSSYEDLRKMLMVAITEGSVGFAFA